MFQFSCASYVLNDANQFISCKIYTFVALVTNIFCDTGILALQQGVKTAVLEMWVISCILGSH